MPAIRESITVFAGEMENKLRRDDHQKESWEVSQSILLSDYLKEEYNELEEAFRVYHATANDPDGKALMLECVDVALCAMMIFSQLHPMTRHNRRGHPEHKIPRP